MQHEQGLRKLIFYSTVGPDRDDDAWGAFRMAMRAINASLECEIFLSGPATGLMRRSVREGLEGRPKESFDAVMAAKIPIYFSPG